MCLESWKDYVEFHFVAYMKLISQYFWKRMKIENSINISKKEQKKVSNLEITALVQKYFHLQVEKQIHLKENPLGCNKDLQYTLILLFQ